jgi:hypothetical protein
MAKQAANVCVDLSTTEFEFFVVIEASKELLWLKMIGL